MCFGYPQHMFWLRNKKNNFPLRTLIWGPAICGKNKNRKKMRPGNTVVGGLGEGGGYEVGFKMSK